MTAKIVDALVLQTYAVEHPHRCLCHPRIGVALTRMKGGTLDDDAAKLTQVDEIGKLQSIAEGAGGCHDRVLQNHVIYFYT